MKKHKKEILNMESNNKVKEKKGDWVIDGDNLKYQYRHDSANPLSLKEAAGKQVELANYIADYFIDRRSFELFKNAIEQLVINESIKSCKNWLHIFKNTDPNDIRNWYDLGMSPYQVFMEYFSN